MLLTVSTSHHVLTLMLDGELFKAPIKDNVHVQYLHTLFHWPPADHDAESA
jgi:hypothetical protein